MSVLSKIVGNEKATEKKLDSIETTVEKMYSLQLKTAKMDQLAEKRRAQSTKRKGGDVVTKLFGGKEGIKKEKKNIFKALLDSLGGLFSGGLGPILAKLGLGAAIGGYFGSKEFRDFVNQYVLQPMGTAIYEGLFGSNGFFGQKNLNSLTESLFGKEGFFGAKNLDEMYKGIKAWFVEDAPWKVTMREGIHDFFVKDAEWKKDIRSGFSFMIDGLKNMVGAAVNWVGEKLGFGALSRWMQGEQNRQRANFGMAPRSELRREQLTEATNIYDQDRNDADREKYLKQVRYVNSLEQRVMNLNLQVRQKEEGLKKLKHPPFIKEAKENIKDKKDELKGARNDLKYAKTQMESTMESLRGKGVQIQGLQTGGPLTVPGHSTGDKHSAILAPGSFVLNRNASGYQTGGIPAMLESGEKVYGPGQWGPREMMLNSAIPRFQTGGVVATDGHADTGPGFTMGKDYKGRPVVLSESAAKALMSAINASGGAVKTSDVTSSTRSRSKNAAVGGVPNSNHLFGNAIDIHGTSKAWLKQNGMNHGWKNLVYSGHDGHFDFIKGGARLVPGDGDESTASTTGKDGGGGVMSSLMKLGGQVGQFFKQIMSAIGGAFGDSGLMSILFGSGGGSDNNTIFGAGVGPAGAGGAGATSISDPNAKALLNAIADAEGTSQYANQGYNTMFTGKQFKNMIDHPRQIQSSGGYSSDAAGRYQFLSTTWDEYSNGKNMMPQNQDRVALDLVSKKRGVNISDGLSKNEVYKLGQEWASIEGGPNGVPGGSYGGQAKFSADKFMAMYKSYGGEIEGFQNGGVVNMKGSGNGPNISQKSENQFIDRLSAAMTPVVVPVPTGGGGAAGGGGSGATNRSIPSLSANPSNSVALDLAYRLSVGAAFS